MTNRKPSWVAILHFCGGVTMPNDIKGNEKLQKAYELGKQIL